MKKALLDDIRERFFNGRARKIFIRCFSRFKIDKMFHNAKMPLWIRHQTTKKNQAISRER